MYGNWNKNEIFSTKSRFMLLEIDIDLNVIGKCISMTATWGATIEKTKMHWNLLPEDRFDYVLILD